MRILFVSDSIREPLTGVGRVALTVMREFADLGVKLIGLDHQPNEVAHSICGDVRILPCHGRLGRMGRWHLTLLRRIPSLGVSHDVLFDPTGYPDAFGSHPRLCVLVHDLSMFDPHTYRPGKRAFFRAFYARALTKAGLCVCVSEHTRRQLLARFDLDPERCVVVPNSLDPRFGEELQGCPHPETPADPYFLTVGTIERRKNIHRLLEAFAATDLPHRLVLAGRAGHGGGELLAAARDLNNRVITLHGVSDRELMHLYRGATALLFPSLDEGFGLPILEAMQADIPVLTSNTAAMPEVAGDAALLVDPEDVSAITAGIRQLTDDVALRNRLIAKGRLRLPNFAARHNAETLLGHLQGLVAVR